MSTRPSRCRGLGAFLAKLAFTGVCLAWAFSQMDWDHSVFRNPGDLSLPWLAGGVAMAGIAVWLCALRWWFFLRAQDLDVSMMRATELTLIGNFFSLLSLGGIGGDAARVFLLIREHPGRKLVITMAVMVDRLAGIVALALIFFAVSAARFEALADPSVLGRGVIRFAWFQLGGGIALVMLFFLMASPPLHHWIYGSGRFDRWPWIRRVPEIYDVYRVRWRHALAGLAASVLMFFVFFGSFWCAMRGVGSEVAAADVITAMPVIDAVSGLPISIAGVGVREKLFEVLMGDLAGVPASTAVAASLLGFACNTLWALLGAFLFLRNRGHATVSDIEREAATVE